MDRGINFVIIVIIFLIVFVPFVRAGIFDFLMPSDPVLENLIVEIHGPTVLRSGDSIEIRPLILNNNTENSVRVKSIKFLNSNEEIVENSNVDKILSPIKNEIDEINNLVSTQNNFEFEQRYKELETSIQEGILSEGFIFNVQDFDSSLEVGEVIPISIEIEI